MWTIEDEEKYLDMDIMKSLLTPKRTVKGDLETDTYIQEKKVEFTLTSFFNNEISLYLPEGRMSEHYGSRLFYFDKMGEYVEYVSSDDSIVFTIEKCSNNQFGVEDKPEDEDLYEMLLEELEEKYEDTVGIYWEDFYLDNCGLNVYVLRATSEIDDEDCEGLIYFISDDKVSYRFYLASYKKDIELIDALGQKIVEKIAYK